MSDFGFSELVFRSGLHFVGSCRSLRAYFVIDCNGRSQYTYSLRSRGVQCPNSPLSDKALI